MLSFMVILILALHTCLSELDMLHPDQPCTAAKDKYAYDTFLHRHLRKDTPADPNNLRAWQKFIDKIDTWNRPIQSFFPFHEARQVFAVCSSGGKVYKGNLCISKKPLMFFKAEVNNKKQVRKVKVQKQHVILGCDKIGKKCQPVHFEANINDVEPDNNKDCSKAMINMSSIHFEEFF